MDSINNSSNTLFLNKSPTKGLHIRDSHGAQTSSLFLNYIKRGSGPWVHDILTSK
ncbi:hypothetical protein GVAV_003177 [Gurleya vavrai]